MEKPMAACYLCVTQLRKCQEFIEQVIQADELLTQMLKTGNEITSKSIAMVDRKTHKLSANLTIAPIECNVFDCQPLLEIKKEVLYDIEEVTYVEEKLQGAKEDISPTKETICKSILDQHTIKQEQSIPENSSEEKTEFNVSESQKWFFIDVIKEENENILICKPDESANNCVDKNPKNCGTNFINKSILADHIKTHNPFEEKVYFKCDSCPYRDVDLDSFEKHVLIHNNTTSIEGVSSESGTTQNNSCRKEDMNESTACGYKSNSKGNLNIRLRIHTGEKPYKCTVCEYRCSQKVRLNEHWRIHTGDKPFKCTVCGYRCNREYTLKRHLKRHTGEKPYQCMICKYSFIEKGALLRHLRTHAGEKPYQCNICKYKCTDKSTLYTHLRIHGGEKPYVCTVCEYRCSQTSNLKAHLRTHTGEKPFKCTVCEYRSNREHTLKKHLKTHTGEKPFQCTFCEYSCSEKGTLKRHLRTHARETV